MRLNNVKSLYSILIISFLINCATAPETIRKQNPKLFEEIIKEYFVVSEENFGKVNTLKFVEDEKQSILGKVDNFPIENCTWFFDRKISKNNPDELQPISKTVNLNCGGQYYILDFDRNNLQANKLKYKGAYKKIFHQLKKAIILEASCSIDSVDEKGNDDKYATVECYPYPHDLERYTKTQKREVIAGYFLYTDKSLELDELILASKEEQDNYKIFDTLKKNFRDEKSANNKETNPAIGQNFSFKNCEFIDFREVSVENAKGKEINEKIAKYLDSDLNNPANKEGLRDAVEEYKSCGKLCVSNEKEFQIIFEARNSDAKRKILLIKKIDTKSELSQYKRFHFYPVEGFLQSIDFSIKGEIEKIYLNNSSDDTQNSIPKNESKEKNNELEKSNSEKKKNLIEEESPKPEGVKKNKNSPIIQPLPEPEDNSENL